MTDAAIDFAHAQPEGEWQARTCGACKRPLTDSYWIINGLATCAHCKESVQAFGKGGSPALRTVKAIGLGCLGGAAGAAIWWAVAHFLNFQAGLVAIAVGFLVGGGVRMGSDRVGGWFYQLIAIGISYVAIVAGWYPDVLEQMRAEPDASQGIGLYIVAFIVAIVAPVMTSIMGTIITAIALYEAWKLNKRPAFNITGPHSLSATAAPSGGTIPPPLPSPSGPGSG